MYQIKYIIVNDSAAKSSAFESRHRFIPHIGHCAECFAVSGFKVQGSRERAKLLDELCRLRRQWPEAPIREHQSWTPLQVSPPCRYPLP